MNLTALVVFIALAGVGYWDPFLSAFALITNALRPLVNGIAGGAIALPDFTGNPNAPLGQRAGLRAVEEIDEVAILCCPDEYYPNIPPGQIAGAIVDQCERLKDRFAILQAQNAAGVINNDPDWKYVNVRRLVIFLEESIEEATRWVVFEPNDEPTWARVRRSVSNFLTRSWKDGMLRADRPWRRSLCAATAPA